MNVIHSLCGNNDLVKDTLLKPSVSSAAKSILLQCVSTLLQCVSTLLQCVSTLLQCVSTLLQCVSTLLQCVSTLLQCVSILLFLPLSLECLSLVCSFWGCPPTISPWTSWFYRFFSVALTEGIPAEGILFTKRLLILIIFINFYGEGAYYWNLLVL